MKTIQPKELQPKLKDGLLLDVRTPAEHRGIHIPGSHLIPLHELDPNKVEELVSKGKPCYLVCRSGQRATQAAEKLRAAGLNEVVVLEGGVAAWEAAGLPVNRGRSIISVERQTRITIGLMVLLGAVLGYSVHPGFHVLSAFMGIGLIIAGITNWCGLGLLIARMPWNNCGASCSN